MKILLASALLSLMLIFSGYSQPATEVILFKIISTRSSFTLQSPVNISNNPGYDNQPSFSADGKEIYFASTRNGQTDVRAYSIEEETHRWITETPGSEYSPLPMPAGKSISTIVLETDGTQLLRSYPVGEVSRQHGTVLMPDSVVGYHAWDSNGGLLAFVLGNPAKLFYRNAAGQIFRVDAIPGRSLHSVNNGAAFSFVNKAKNPWVIELFSSPKGETKEFAPVFSNVEDMAWLTSAIPVMGSGSKLMMFSNNEWREWINLETFGYSGITRLAVSNNGKYLAVVVAEN